MRRFLRLRETPISQDDRDTQAVFGEYISVYDIQQAVDDGVTVPIYYESRLAKINLNQAELPHIDEEVEEILDSEAADEREKERAKTQWSALEAIVGSDTRLREVAEDLINHYDSPEQDAARQVADRDDVAVISACACMTRSWHCVLTGILMTI